MRIEHKSWSEMLFKGLYRIRKILAIKSNELNVIFVDDRMTWSGWMRTLKYDKQEVCCEIISFLVSHRVISRFQSIGARGNLCKSKSNRIIYI